MNSALSTQEVCQVPSSKKRPTVAIFMPEQIINENIEESGAPHSRGDLAVPRTDLDELTDRTAELALKDLSVARAIRTTRRIASYNKVLDEAYDRLGFSLYAAPKGEKVFVQSTSGWHGWVTKKTLSKNPGKYKPISQDQQEALTKTYLGKHKFETKEVSEHPVDALKDAHSKPLDALAEDLPDPVSGAPASVHLPDIKDLTNVVKDPSNDWRYEGTDAQGRKYEFWKKPAHLAIADQCASSLASLVFPAGYVVPFKATHGAKNPEVSYIIRPMHSTKLVECIGNLSVLGEAELGKLAAEAVFSFSLGTKPNEKSFSVDAQGKVLRKNYVGALEPYGQTVGANLENVMKFFAAKHDPNDLLPIVKQIESIPDDKWLATIQPALDAQTLSSVTKAEIVNWLLKNKKNIRTRVEQAVDAAKGDKKGTFHFEEKPEEPAELAAPPPVEQPLVSSTIPTADQLKFMGTAHIGGTKAKYFLEDHAGNKYIFKRNQDKPFRDYIQQTVGDLSGMIAGSEFTVPIAAMTIQTPSGPMRGSVQPMLQGVVADGKKLDLKPEQLTATQKSDMARETVLDWVFGNHDGHRGNLLLLENGHLVGVDKEQAFKHILEDSLSTSYHPNAKYGEEPPFKNALYRAYAQGKVDLNLNDVLPYIQQTEKITDEKWMAAVTPYIEALVKDHGFSEAAKQTLKTAILSRKHNLRDDFRKFFTGLNAQKGLKEGTFTFSDESAPGVKLPEASTEKAPAMEALPETAEPTGECPDGHKTYKLPVPDNCPTCGKKMKPVAKAAPSFEHKPLNEEAFAAFVKQNKIKPESATFYALNALNKSDMPMSMADIGGALSGPNKSALAVVESQLDKLVGKGLQSYTAPDGMKNFFFGEVAAPATEKTGVEPSVQPFMDHLFNINAKTDKRVAADVANALHDLSQKGSFTRKEFIQHILEKGHQNVGWYSQKAGNWVSIFLANKGVVESLPGGSFKLVENAISKEPTGKCPKGHNTYLKPVPEDCPSCGTPMAGAPEVPEAPPKAPMTAAVEEFLAAYPETSAAQVLGGLPLLEGYKQEGWKGIVGTILGSKILAGALFEHLQSKGLIEVDSEGKVHSKGLAVPETAPAEPPAAPVSPPPMPEGLAPIPEVPEAPKPAVEPPPMPETAPPLAPEVVEPAPVEAPEHVVSQESYDSMVASVVSRMAEGAGSDYEAGKLSALAKALSAKGEMTKEEAVEIAENKLDLLGSAFEKVVVKKAIDYFEDAGLLKRTPTGYQAVVPEAAAVPEVVQKVAPTEPEVEPEPVETPKEVPMHYIDPKKVFDAMKAFYGDHITEEQANNVASVLSELKDSFGSVVGVGLLKQALSEKGAEPPMGALYAAGIIKQFVDSEGKIKVTLNFGGTSEQYAPNTMLGAVKSVFYGWSDDSVTMLTNGLNSMVKGVGIPEHKFKQYMASAFAGNIDELLPVLTTKGLVQKQADGSIVVATTAKDPTAECKSGHKTYLSPVPHNCPTCGILMQPKAPEQIPVEPSKSPAASALESALGEYAGKAKEIVGLYQAHLAEEDGSLGGLAYVLEGKLGVPLAGVSDISIALMDAGVLVKEGDKYAIKSPYVSTYAVAAPEAVPDKAAMKAKLEQEIASSDLAKYGVPIDIQKIVTTLKSLDGPQGLGTDGGNAIREQLIASGVPQDDAWAATSSVILALTHAGVLAKDGRYLKVNSPYEDVGAEPVWKSWLGGYLEKYDVDSENAEKVKNAVEATVGKSKAEMLAAISKLGVGYNGANSIVSFLTNNNLLEVTPEGSTALTEEASKPKTPAKPKWHATLEKFLTDNNVAPDNIEKVVQAAKGLDGKPLSDWKAALAKLVGSFTGATKITNYLAGEGAIHVDNYDTVYFSETWDKQANEPTLEPKPVNETPLPPAEKTYDWLTAKGALDVNDAMGAWEKAHPGLISETAKLVLGNNELVTSNFTSLGLSQQEADDFIAELSKQGFLYTLPYSDGTKETWFADTKSSPTATCPVGHQTYVQPFPKYCPTCGKKMAAGSVAVSWDPKASVDKAGKLGMDPKVVAAVSALADKFGGESFSRLDILHALKNAGATASDWKWLKHNSIIETSSELGKYKFAHPDKPPQKGVPYDAEVDLDMVVEPVGEYSAEAKAAQQLLDTGSSKTVPSKAIAWVMNSPKPVSFQQICNAVNANSKAAQTKILKALQVASLDLDILKHNTGESLYFLGHFAPKTELGEASVTPVTTFAKGKPLPVEELHGVPFQHVESGFWQKTSDKPLNEPEFKNIPGKTKSSGLLIQEPDGRIWIVEPTNHYGGYQHTIPKGGVETGLSPQQNAIKEAYEESGLQCEISGFLGDFEGDTSNTRYYIAKRVGGTPTDAHWESQSVKLVTPEEALKHLNKQRDKDIINAHLALAQGTAPQPAITPTLKEVATPKEPTGKCPEGHETFKAPVPIYCPTCGKPMQDQGIAHPLATEPNYALQICGMQETPLGGVLQATDPNYINVPYDSTAAEEGTIVPLIAVAKPMFGGVATTADHEETKSMLQQELIDKLPDLADDKVDADWLLQNHKNTLKVIIGAVFDLQAEQGPVTVNQISQKLDFNALDLDIDEDHNEFLDVVGACIGPVLQRDAIENNKFFIGGWKKAAPPKPAELEPAKMVMPNAAAVSVHTALAGTQFEQHVKTVELALEQLVDYGQCSFWPTLQGVANALGKKLSMPEGIELCKLLADKGFVEAHSSSTGTTYSIKKPVVPPMSAPKSAVVPFSLKDYTAGKIAQAYTPFDVESAKKLYTHFSPEIANKIATAVAGFEWPFSFYDLADDLQSSNDYAESIADDLAEAGLLQKVTVGGFTSFFSGHWEKTTDEPLAPPAQSKAPTGICKNKHKTYVMPMPHNCPTCGVVMQDVASFIQEAAGGSVANLIPLFGNPEAASAWLEQQSGSYLSKVFWKLEEKLIEAGLLQADPFAFFSGPGEKVPSAWAPPPDIQYVAPPPGAEPVPTTATPTVGAGKPPQAMWTKELADSGAIVPVVTDYDTEKVGDWVDSLPNSDDGAIYEDLLYWVYWKQAKENKGPMTAGDMAELLLDKDSSSLSTLLQKAKDEEEPLDTLLEKYLNFAASNSSYLTKAGEGPEATYVHGYWTGAVAAPATPVPADLSVAISAPSKGPPVKKDFVKHIEHAYPSLDEKESSTLAAFLHSSQGHVLTKSQLESDDSLTASVDTLKWNGFLKKVPGGYQVQLPTAANTPDLAAVQSAVPDAEQAYKAFTLLNKQLGVEEAGFPPLDSTGLTKLISDKLQCNIADAQEIVLDLIKGGQIDLIGAEVKIALPSTKVPAQKWSTAKEEAISALTDMGLAQGDKIWEALNPFDSLAFTGVAPNPKKVWPKTIDQVANALQDQMGSLYPSDETAKKLLASGLLVKTHVGTGDVPLYSLAQFAESPTGECSKGHKTYVHPMPKYCPSCGEKMVKSEPSDLLEELMDVAGPAPEPVSKPTIHQKLTEALDIQLKKVNGKIVDNDKKFVDALAKALSDLAAYSTSVDHPTIKKAIHSVVGNTSNPDINYSSTINALVNSGILKINPGEGYILDLEVPTPGSQDPVQQVTKLLSGALEGKIKDSLGDKFEAFISAIAPTLSKSGQISSKEFYANIIEARNAIDHYSDVISGWSLQEALTNAGLIEVDEDTKTVTLKFGISALSAPAAPQVPTPAPQPTPKPTFPTPPGTENWLPSISDDFPIVSDIWATAMAAGIAAAEAKGTVSAGDMRDLILAHTGGLSVMNVMQATTLVDQLKSTGYLHEFEPGKFEVTKPAGKGELPLPSPVPWLPTTPLVPKSEEAKAAPKPKPKGPTFKPVTLDNGLATMSSWSAGGKGQAVFKAISAAGEKGATLEEIVAAAKPHYTKGGTELGASSATTCIEAGKSHDVIAQIPGTSPPKYVAGKFEMPSDIDYGVPLTFIPHEAPEGIARQSYDAAAKLGYNLYDEGHRKAWLASPYYEMVQGMACNARRGAMLDKHGVSREHVQTLVERGILTQDGYRAFNKAGYENSIFKIAVDPKVMDGAVGTPMPAEVMFDDKGKRTIYLSAEVKDSVDAICSSGGKSGLRPSLELLAAMPSKMWNTLDFSEQLGVSQSSAKAILGELKTAGYARSQGDIYWPVWPAIQAATANPNSPMCSKCGVRHRDGHVCPKTAKIGIKATLPATAPPPGQYTIALAPEPKSALDDMPTAATGNAGPKMTIFEALATLKEKGIPVKKGSMPHHIVNLLQTPMSLTDLQIGMQNAGFKKLNLQQVADMVDAGVIAQLPNKKFALKGHGYGGVDKPAPGKESGLIPDGTKQPVHGADAIRAMYSADHPVQTMNAAHAKRYTELAMYFRDVAASSDKPISERTLQSSLTETGKRIHPMVRSLIKSICMDWKGSSHDGSDQTKLVSDTLEQMGAASCWAYPDSLSQKNKLSTIDPNLTSEMTKALTQMGIKDPENYRSMSVHHGTFIMHVHDVDAPMFQVASQSNFSSLEQAQTKLGAENGVKLGSKYLLQGPSRADSFLQQMAMTHAVMAHQGMTNMSLFRGISSSSAYNTATKEQIARKGLGAKASMRSASSWSSQISTALGFGSALTFRKDDLPVHRLFVNFEHHQDDPVHGDSHADYSFLGSEHESITMGFETHSVEPISQMSQHKILTKVAFHFFEPPLPDKTIPTGWGKMVTNPDGVTYWVTNNNVVWYFNIDEFDDSNKLSVGAVAGARK